MATVTTTTMVRMLYLSIKCPAGFSRRAASSVAAEYTAANMVWETPISPNKGMTTRAIRKVCPGAEDLNDAECKKKNVPLSKREHLKRYYPCVVGGIYLQECTLDMDLFFFDNCCKGSRCAMKHPYISYIIHYYLGGAIILLPL